jgi:hypothetical protein
MMIRKVLCILIPISLVLCFFLCQYFVQSLEGFYICYFILFIVCSLIEGRDCLILGTSNLLYSKIIPPTFLFYGKRKDFCQYLSITMGKIFGCLIITVSFHLINHELHLLVAFSICAFLYIFCFGFLISKFKDLRVKAISRIIKKMGSKLI